MRYLLFAFILLMFFATPLLALGNYEKGIAAFERSDYEEALREFRSLAEQKTRAVNMAWG